MSQAPVEATQDLGGGELGRRDSRPPPPPMGSLCNGGSLQGCRSVLRKRATDSRCELRERDVGNVGDFRSLCCSNGGPQVKLDLVRVNRSSASGRKVGIGSSAVAAPTAARPTMLTRLTLRRRSSPGSSAAMHASVNVESKELPRVSPDVRHKRNGPWWWLVQNFTSTSYAPSGNRSAGPPRGDRSHNRAPL